ncbi:MAG: M48 family metallopeptidase [Desulfobacteraceae bacterium]|nr:M48 family metallopeptidase [Desulfobacteraceae bacterium]
MIRIPGIFFDGKSAKAYKTVLEYDGIYLYVKGNNIALEKCHLNDSCTIIPKLGDTRRVIMFRSGQRFETDDSIGIERLEHSAGINRSFKLISFLESQWKTVVVCMVGLIAIVYGFISFGIPFIAKDIAFRLPSNTMNRISMDAEVILDQRFFKPSQLDEDRKNRIRQMFYTLARNSNSDQVFSLRFRQSKALGANAFALPSGLIVMTDKLVETSEDNREIEGILVHEMAHVIHRHGLRSVIQNTGVVLLISMLVGDIASITSLAASIPTLIVESGYSRKFETQADEAVGLHFMSKGLDIKFFENILIRITKEKPGLKGSKFLSTHPETIERIKHLQNFISHAK